MSFRKWMATGLRALVSALESQSPAVGQVPVPQCDSLKLEEDIEPSIRLSLVKNECDAHQIRRVDEALILKADADFLARLQLVFSFEGFERQASGRQLAKAIGRSASAVGKWRRGEAAMTVSDARRICAATGTSLVWLVAGKGPVRGDV